MLISKPVSINITKDSVRAANPEFFSVNMMNFIGTTDADWEVIQWNNQTCVFVSRPAAQAVACYIINPITLKLAFWCHLGDKLTRL